MARTDSTFVAHIDRNTEVRVKKLCAKPNIYVIDDFISKDECDQVINTAKIKGLTPEYYVFPKLKEILTVSKEEGEKHIRAETTGHVFDKRNKVIRKVLTRLEKITHFKDIKLYYPRVSHYSTGGFVEEHHHYPTNGQIMTYLIYLNDVEEGGETYFVTPKIKVRPKAGRALLFFDTLHAPLPESDETICSKPPCLDPDSLHSALPVARGEKWILVGMAR